MSTRAAAASAAAPTAALLRPGAAGAAVSIHSSLFVQLRNTSGTCCFHFVSNPPYFSHCPHVFSRLLPILMN
jgi:hypothetical protein